MKLCVHVLFLATEIGYLAVHKLIRSTLAVSAQ